MGKVWEVDAIALQFLMELDSADCSTCFGWRDYTFKVMRCK